MQTQRTKRNVLPPGYTAVVINDRTIYYYPDAEVKVGTILAPFLWRTQFMSYSALLHLLRMARSIMTEQGERPHRLRFINNILDYFRGFNGREDLKIRNRLIATICNMVLTSEGLGKLPEEIIKYHDVHEEGKITGFTPKREGGF